MAGKASDQNYLLNQQYKDASNLNARSALHARFSTNKQGWNTWLFNQFTLPPTARILELGCGPGGLWRANRDRIPAGWDITLTDFSPGMLAEAQQYLDGFTFRQVDAQSIPFDDNSFDAVIANHMLYHVPDRAKALSEISRVLKPEGRFYASTVGEKHMKEVNELIRQFDPAQHIASFSGDAFTLENGGAQIAAWLPQVTLKRYEDALVVTEVEPLVAYILSGIRAENVAADQVNTFRAFLTEEMAATGAIVITKDSGLFEAWRD